MRVLERSEFRDENGKISLQNRLRGSLRYGPAWFGIMQAQETVTETLSRSLSNDYHLLRNVHVPGTGLIASMILIGPQGVYTLLATPTRGVFRAKDEEWMSHSGGHFRPVRPNLQGALWRRRKCSSSTSTAWATACRKSTPPSFSPALKRTSIPFTRGRVSCWPMPSSISPPTCATSRRSWTGKTRSF
jgi:hypothetical protein